MKITKYGHCCMLIEQKGLRILTDPGSFTIDAQEKISNVDVVLITHEHADHFHIPSLKNILSANPAAVVVCGPDVGEHLDREGIAHYVVSDGEEHKEKGVSIKGRGAAHAVVHHSIPQARNTGYLIDDSFFYPGDAFTDPKQQIAILALPTAGPWMKLSEAIDFALALKPRLAFPVHDFVASPEGQAITRRVASGILGKNGVVFQQLDLDKEYDL